MKTWYASVSAGGHQGLVADEETGRTVALTYDPADAPLVAEAPAMLEALQAIDARIRGEWDHPALVKFGPLSCDTLYDVNRIMCEIRNQLENLK